MIYKRLPRLDLALHPYFLTCCLEKRRPLFNNKRLAESLLNLYVERRDRGKMLLYGYVVMPDHYHIILSLQGDGSISNIVRFVHSQSAIECRKTLNIPGRIWQRRFYDHVIRDEDDWLTKLNYTHNNPVEAGLVENILDWPWSSARFWHTCAGPIRCDGWE